MSETKAKKTKDKPKTKSKAKKNEPKRPATSGSFKPGPDPRRTALFQSGHEPLIQVYDDSFPESLLAYFQREDVVCPTIGGWAVENGISVRTVHDWTKEDSPRYRQEFALICAQCKEIQRNLLINNGLLEAYSPRMVEFLLKNCHGMSDKVEQDIKAKADGTFKVDIKIVD